MIVRPVGIPSGEAWGVMVVSGPGLAYNRITIVAAASDEIIIQPMRVTVTITAEAYARATASR